MTSLFKSTTAGGFAAIVCVAIGLRMGHVIEVSALPTQQLPTGDAESYLSWAGEILAGDWMGDRPFYQAPAYPYFLSLVGGVVGLDPFRIRIVQSLMGGVSVGLIGWVAAQLFRRRTSADDSDRSGTRSGDETTPPDWRIGWIASGLLAVYPPAIYYDGLIQKTSLASLLTCGLLAVWVMAIQSRRWRWFFASGLVLGLLTLTRENALVWVGVLSVWLVRNEMAAALRGLAGRIRRLSKGRRGRGDHPTDVGSPIAKRSRRVKADVQAMLMFWAGVAVTLFPVAVRNASMGGSWSPTTVQAGPNFYIGNNANASGIYEALVPGHGTPKYERTDATELAEAATGRSMTPAEVSRYYMALSFRDIRSDPTRWSQLMLVKSLMLINAFEIPDLESFEVHRQFSAAVGMLGGSFHFGVLIALAVLGVLTRRREDTATSWIIWLAASMAVAVVAFFLLGRYRYPLVPLCIPFAAAASIRFVPWAKLTWRRRSWTGRAVVFGSLAVGALVWAAVVHLPVTDRQTALAGSQMNLGVAAARLGRPGESIQWFRRSIQNDPSSGVTYFNLSMAFADVGRNDLALPAAVLGRQLEPGMVGIDGWIEQLSASPQLE